MQNTTPKRFASVTGLKAEKALYYKQLHANPWSGVNRMLKECNIQNYSIHLKEIDGKLYLFSYLEYTGEDWEADSRKMASDPETQRWWRETDPCQSPLPDAAATGQIWSDMEEVYYLDTPRKKVFVTGCFDLIHSGHVAFLEEASTHGDLYVGIGSDETVKNLKGRYPVYTERERKYMLGALHCVKQCTVNSGGGIMDFVEDLERIGPDILFVNEDGNSPEKEDLCRRKGIQYIVSRRIPHASLPVRSTTTLRTECNIPYRIDLAGGWLDQPFVSRHSPGSVLTISIEPTIEFNDRSGMASSTRRKAVELWKTDLPGGDREQLAKVLFRYDNPPGADLISGSQDALGIVMPGLNRLHYAGGYWPEAITPCLQEDVLVWLENHLSLLPLGPREAGFSVLSETHIDPSSAQRLAAAADSCWKAILEKEVVEFGRWFTEAFEAQVAMFPRMADGSVRDVIDAYRCKAHGWKLSGAGGGGYLILVSEGQIGGTIGIKIRRP